MSSGDRYAGGIDTRAWKTPSALNPGCRSLQLTQILDEDDRRQQQHQRRGDLGHDHGIPDALVPAIADRASARRRSASPARVRRDRIERAAVSSAVTTAVTAIDEQHDRSVEARLRRGAARTAAPIAPGRGDCLDREHPSEAGCPIDGEHAPFDGELPRQLQPRRADRRRASTARPGAPLARTSESDTRLASAVASTTTTAASSTSIDWRTRRPASSCNATDAAPPPLRAYSTGKLLPERTADRRQLRLRLIRHPRLD